MKIVLIKCAIDSVGNRKRLFLAITKTLKTWLIYNQRVRKQPKLTKIWTKSDKMQQRGKRKGIKERKHSKAQKRNQRRIQGRILGREQKCLKLKGAKHGTKLRIVQ